MEREFLINSSEEEYAEIAVDNNLDTDDENYHNNFNLSSILENLNKIANGLFSANLLDINNEKCVSNYGTKIRKDIALRKSADVLSTFITVYDLISSNNEYLNVMRKIKAELGESKFKLLIKKDLNILNSGSILDPDSDLNKNLYSRKKLLDVTKVVFSLTYLISEQILPNKLVPLATSILYVFSNSISEIFKKNRGITSKIEKQNNIIKKFLNGLKSAISNEDNVELGNQSSLIDNDKREKILGFLTSKCDCCYSIIDIFKDLDPVKILADNISTMGLIWSSTFAALNINKFIEERNQSVGCEKDFFEAEKNASASALGVLIPEYGLLSLRHVYYFVKNTKDLVKNYGASSTKEVFINTLKSLNNLIGATSSAFAGYSLYNTATESEEKTVEKVLIADAFLIFSGFVESLNKRNNLFEGIYNKGNSLFNFLSNCCCSMSSQISNKNLNKEPLIMEKPTKNKTNSIDNNRSWVDRVNTQQISQSSGQTK